MRGLGGARTQGAAPTRIDRDGAARTFSTYTSFGYFSRCAITRWRVSHTILPCSGLLCAGILCACIRAGCGN